MTKRLLNVLRFCLTGRPLKLEKPNVIQFPVIDICNSKCQMCKIWENKKSSDITVAQLTKGLQNGLFSEVEAIGFNGGEPTLRKDLSELVQTSLNALPKLKYVSLITNAFKYQQVIRQIESMGKIINNKKIHFDVMVSLDGYADIHDTVRGKIGNFERAQKVIRYAKQSPLVNELRIGCTVIKENVLHLSALLEYCIDNELYVKYRLGIPHQRLYTENIITPYKLTDSDRYEFAEFLENLIIWYEVNDKQILFYRSLIDQIIHNKPRVAGCDWQHRGATITAKGELAYCAVKSKSLMKNIAQGDPEEVYFSNEDHLREIISNECDKCNHDYVGVPGKSAYRKLLLKRIDRRLGVITLVKQLPGYRLINGFRKRYNFNKSIHYHRGILEHYNINSTQEKKILICGWYGTETLGDKAIIAGIMDTYRNLYGSTTQFFVATFNTYITDITKQQMPEFENVQLVTMEQGINLSRKVDIVTFGGGPMMALDELAPIQVLFENANKSGVLTVIGGCGVGPLGESWYRKSISRILQLADIRIYRDRQSLLNAKQLNIDTKTDLVAEDPAFTWLQKINTKNNQEPLVVKALNENKKVLLLGLRSFPYKEYAKHLKISDGVSIKKNCEKSIISALNLLIEKYPSLVIKPLPMCTNHFGGDDRWFYRNLFRGHSSINQHLDDSLLGPEMAPIKYLEHFRTADALLAMRFHSLVFGLSTSCNTVVIDYTLGKGKVSALAKKFGIDVARMTEMTGTSLANQLELQINDTSQSSFITGQLTFEQSLKDKLKSVSEEVTC